MSLAPEVTTFLARPEASGFAVSSHLLLWRFPFNGLFRADTSEGSSVGRGKRRPLSSFAAALEGEKPICAGNGNMGGGAIPECAGHWWRRSSGAWRNGGEGDAYPSSSAREGIRGGGGWGGRGRSRRAVTAALAPPCAALRREPRSRRAARGRGRSNGRSSAAARASPAVPLPGRMRRLFPAAAGRRGRR